jgi:hypothetical protein
MAEMTNRTGSLRASAIADYALLSDCSSAALVDRRGSIDLVVRATFRLALGAGPAAR